MINLKLYDKLFVCLVQKKIEIREFIIAVSSKINLENGLSLMELLRNMILLGLVKES